MTLALLATSVFSWISGARTACWSGKAKWAHIQLAFSKWWERNLCRGRFGRACAGLAFRCTSCFQRGRLWGWRGGRACILMSTLIHWFTLPGICLDQHQVGSFCFSWSLQCTRSHFYGFISWRLLCLWLSWSAVVMGLKEKNSYYLHFAWFPIFLMHAPLGQSIFLSSLNDAPSISGVFTLFTSHLRCFLPISTGWHLCRPKVPLRYLQRSAIFVLSLCLNWLECSSCNFPDSSHRRSIQPCHCPIQPSPLTFMCLSAWFLDPSRITSD